MEDHTASLDVENDLFNFETDHLALRGNEDYCEVLKTIVILTAQREKALKDYKTVAELRVEALKDPLETFNKIRNGIDLGVPPLYELPKLPVIDFKKYKVKVPENQLLEIYSDGPQEDKTPDLKVTTIPQNRAWTPEEQRRLEELLKFYPPEPVEMRRFHKIAKALGNRTVQQVSSRVQKYFLKLYKAGLPIPGRIPKSAEKYKKYAQHKHQRHNHYLLKPTTFFPGLSVPVQMDNLDSIPGPSSETCDSPSQDNYLLRTDYHQSSEQDPSESSAQLHLKLLKRVREVKDFEEAEGSVPFTHVGFKCDYCDETPLLGTRWHCTTCPESVDFCTDCVVAQLYTETPHPLEHWLACYEGESETGLMLGETVQAYDKQIEEELMEKIDESDNNGDCSD